MADGFGLFADIKCISGFGLHSVGGLHRLDATVQKFILAEGAFVIAIQLLNQIKLLTLFTSGELFILQKSDHLIRLDDRAVETGTLMPGRQETAASAGTATPAGAKDNEAGEILIFGT